MVFAGDCNTNYIEVKSGGSSGRVLKKICSGTSANLKTFSNQIFINFVKGSATSSFEGTWTTDDLECCSKVQLENHASVNFEYQLDTATGAYQQTGVDSNPELLYRRTNDEGPIWAVGPPPMPSGFRLFSSDVATCPEYIRGPWKYYDGTR